MITSSFENFVDNNINLALRVAKKYTRAFPTKYDDIRSVALCALVKAARDIESGKIKHDNFSAYLVVKIRGEILRFINRDHVVRKHKVVPLIDKITAHDTGDEENTPQMDADEGLVIDVPCMFSEMVNDFIYHLSPEEKTVLGYRLESYTLDEIADKLGRSRFWVETRCNTIRDKYIKGQRS